MPSASSLTSKKPKKFSSPSASSSSCVLLVFLGVFFVLCRSVVFLGFYNSFLLTTLDAPADGDAEAADAPGADGAAHAKGRFPEVGSREREVSRKTFWKLIFADVPRSQKRVGRSGWTATAGGEPSHSQTANGSSGAAPSSTSSTQSTISSSTPALSTPARISPGESSPGESSPGESSPTSAPPTGGSGEASPPPPSAITEGGASEEASPPPPSTAAGGGSGETPAPQCAPGRLDLPNHTPLEDPEDAEDAADPDGGPGEDGADAASKKPRPPWPQIRLGIGI